MEKAEDILSKAKSLFRNEDELFNYMRMKSIGVNLDGYWNNNIYEITVDWNDRIYVLNLPATVNLYAVVETKENKEFLNDFLTYNEISKYTLGESVVVESSLICATDLDYYLSHNRQLSVKHNFIFVVISDVSRLEGLKDDYCVVAFKREGEDCYLMNSDYIIEDYSKRAGIDLS